ncbi:hypothetical protein [Chryseobacterium echinoideorum]|uniref:hypothetical protein n=1 Tax=Chryseobacterium echinoideorum TaxID=1549648 RepID=UPI001186ED78|nr:hypothetical protein [Chryseobacterium echinoideorum]
MIVNIELENSEDFAFIKQLLEKIKGVKSVSVQKEEYEMIEGVPAHVFDAIEQYGKSLKDEDMISQKDFLKFIDEEICRLNSQK